MDFADPSNLAALIGPAYLIGAAVPLSVIDVQQRRLPNRLVLPGLPIALAGQLLGCALGGQWLRMLVALGWLLSGFAFALLFNRLNALGMGDVKLIALICLNLGWFGWQWPLAALTTAFGVATVLVLAFFAAGRYRLSSTIPLGPYLLTGFLASAIGLVVS